MSAEMPDMEASVHLKIDPSRIPKNLRPATKDVISLLSYYKKVAHIVNNSSYDDYDVMMTLMTLISKGVVETVSESSLKKKAPFQLLTAEEGLAMKENLKKPFRDGYDMDLVKIPVFYEDFSSVTELADLLSSIEGFILERGLFESKKSSSLIGEIGRIKASENITLLFLAFPMDPSFSPLWMPLLGDSVGAIMLRKEAMKGIKREIEQALKVSLKLDTAIINVNRNLPPMEDKDRFQLNMWEIEKDGGPKAIHSILEYFLSL